MATLQSSGTISINDLKGHYGDTGSSSLSEFYRNGSLVHNTKFNENIPKSGAISLSNFYSADNREYSLVASPTQVNETTNRDVTITLTTKNVANGTEVYSETSGITPEDDIVGGSGTSNVPYTFTVNNNTASVQFTVKADRTTESTTPERAYTVLYTSSSSGIPIGLDHAGPTPDPSGDYATSYFDISDTSKTWFSAVVSPDGAPPHQVYIEEIEAEPQGTGSVFASITAFSDQFKVNAGNNEPGNGLEGEGTTWSVSADFDNSYGRVIHSSTDSDLTSANSTALQGTGGLYNGNSSMATGWPNGTEQPYFQFNREATFPATLPGNQTHSIIISEKGRIVFTEIGAPSGYTNRTLYSDWCIFKSRHDATYGN